MRQAVALIYGFFLVSQMSFGQTASHPDITKFLDAFVRSRSEIKTYSISMTGRFVEYHSRSTDSEKVASFGVRKDIEMVVDHIQDKCLIIVNTRSLAPGMNFYERRPLADSQVYLVNGNRSRFIDRKGVWADFGNANRIAAPDPLAIGAGFCGDAKRFKRLNETIEGLYSWNNTGMQFSTKSALSIFHDSKVDNVGEYESSVSFNTDRGGIITRITHVPNPSLKAVIRGEVDSVNIGGHWLPNRVAYQCAPDQSFFTWDFDWVTVNEPIPDDLFDQEIIEQLLDDTK